MLQDEPLKDSASVLELDPLPALPTASHTLELTHFTAYSEFETLPLVFGEVTMLHVVPFHCSMSVWLMKGNSVLAS